MAGMLPGVECARRRRCHQGGWMEPQVLAGQGRTRRFCLYASNHETHLPTDYLLQRNVASQSSQEGRLEGPAREARQRLDERLRFQRKSESKSFNGKEGIKNVNSNTHLCTAILGLQTEIYVTKKSNLKKFGWGKKLVCKASNQDDCPVCLECFKGGETLVYLPCAHRFHSRCVAPWLESNTNCPCCRTDIKI